MTRAQWAIIGTTVVAVWGSTFAMLALVADNPAPAPCVPGYAVDYRGDLDAWLDAGGVIVLRAPEEDTYPWCTRP